MPDEIARSLAYKKKYAERMDDKLRVAWLSVAIADHRADVARDRLDAMIIKHHDEGVTVSEIARRTHQSRAAIYKILHRLNAFESNTHREEEDYGDAS
jgi:hypothetical protein